MLRTQRAQRLGQDPLVDRWSEDVGCALFGDGFGLQFPLVARAAAIVDDQVLGDRMQPCAGRLVGLGGQEAGFLAITAAAILGPRPRRIPDRLGSGAARSAAAPERVRRGCSRHELGLTGDGLTTLGPDAGSVRSRLSPVIVRHGVGAAEGLLLRSSWVGASFDSLRLLHSSAASWTRTFTTGPTNRWGHAIELAICCVAGGFVMRQIHAAIEAIDEPT